MIILFMQRDFGVYVVNMFDTGQATRVLKNARFSLAHLLKRTVDVDADKQCVNSKHAMHTTHTRALTFRPILPLSPFSLPLTIIFRYQLADWRKRPLPEPMSYYARQDTHFLLHIYALLRDELHDAAISSRAVGDDGSQDLDARLVREVLRRSSEVCLLRYEKPLFTPLAYKGVMKQLRLRMATANERVFAALYDWRDARARSEDESATYVLPNHALVTLARVAPTTVSFIFSLDSMTECLTNIML